MEDSLVGDCLTMSSLLPHKALDARPKRLGPGQIIRPRE